MHAWHATRNKKTDCVVHSVTPGVGHSLLSPLVAHVFKVLRVSAAVWEHGAEWFPLHIEPSIFRFELEHGKDLERAAHNHRSFERVLRDRKPLRAEHASHSDLFVPIVIRGQVAGILVTGPFALKRPTSADIGERWSWLTGRQGHLSDPEFAAYLATALGTLVLEGEKSETYEQLLQCLVSLMAGEGKADELTSRADALRVELEPVRLVERAWDSVQEMIDERFPRVWQNAASLGALRRVGLSRPPEAVLVGLAVSRFRNHDPVDEAVQRDAFQRCAVGLAKRAGETAAGRVGDHGVVLISGARGSAARRRPKPLELIERLARVAREDFGLTLHFGAAEGPETSSLSLQYQAALAAAEAALVQGAKLVVAEAAKARRHRSLRNLREELERTAEEQPDLLSARFDRYLEAVAAHSGYRMATARAHAEVGFECIALPLVRSGALDAKSFDEMQVGLDRAADEARTVHELFAAYRRAISDAANAAAKPVPARRDRSLRRALEYIRHHYTEPIRLEQVARVAGISRTHFSRLFGQHERLTFADYLFALRIERSKYLLSNTELEVARVAELSGFNSVQYFCRAFRRAVAATPLEYRREPAKFGTGRARARATKSKRKATKRQILPRPVA